MSRKRIDITGQQFGDLTVIELSDKRSNNGTYLWKCQCICGNIIYVLSTSLRAGYYKSCGCKQEEKRNNGARKHEKIDCIDHTRKTALKAKLHKDNKSGHKGVIWMESRKKWKAYIGFKGKQITLGYYNHKNDAIAARKKAEEEYHKPYLQQ
jgi:hypothetical protein